MKKKPIGMKKRLTNYGDDDFALFLRKSFIKGFGHTDDALDKPVIGIINTYSDFNSCHGNLNGLVEASKAGVLAAGALPLSFPTISLHESFSFPTSMYLRNLMAMDTEEMMKALPLDACILIGGCDKTVPAQIMGALSANIPFVQLVTGPMSVGSFKGDRVGACTDCRRIWADYRSDNLTDEDVLEASNQLVPTVGTCGVMGTASTMALMVETLGLMVPGGACAPAVSAQRVRIAEESGTLAVKIANLNNKPRDWLTERSFENALRVLLAVGGSTNGIIHLTAMAGRVGINPSLDRLDELGANTPVIVDLKPSGEGYMEDLDKAGGLVRILTEIEDLLHLDELTVSGETLNQVIKRTRRGWPQTVVRTRKTPVFDSGGLAVLKGNLAPDGAIIKQSSASSKLVNHQGRAVVFDGLADLSNRIDDEDLDVSSKDILVLKNIGPKGAPGMPEAGLIPIPKKLARMGVKDMVRISDGRMSGTASGTIVLHVAPEAAVGGPLNYVKNGDEIYLNVNTRTLKLLVSDEELQVRKKMMPIITTSPKRGYGKLFHEHVTQAPQGVDFDFLLGVDDENKL
ncbi:MAG: dihydroxy-acid dehydratase [Rhodobacteraceae bacterium]|nr:dihydroxy-acid dehydratase [Paracoccaceae bacterium]